ATGCERPWDAYAVDASIAAPVVDIEPSVNIEESRALPPAPEEAPSDATPLEPTPTAFDAEAEAQARLAAAREAFEAEWPLHGVVYHFLAQVRARPDRTSPVIGYMRRGARFRAKEGTRGDGCARGWHEVVGGG